MKEILMNMKADEQLEGFDRAYSLAVADTYTQLGATTLALKWRWAALAATGGI